MIRIEITGIVLLSLLLLACDPGPAAGPAPAAPEGYAVSMPEFPDRDFLVTDFGAVPGTDQLNTEAINQAIARCSAEGGGRVVIPGGIWLTGPIRLKSNVNLHAGDGAIVLFTPDFDQYPYIRTWFEGQKDFRATPPLYGDSLENIAITGSGIFDGSGDAWRFVKKDKTTGSQWKALVASGGYVTEDGRQWWPSKAAWEVSTDPGRFREILVTLPDRDQYKAFYRPALLQLVSCDRILLEGPTFQNSPGWCIHPLMCTNLTVEGITVKNPWYAQNGDGIDVESCQYVRIRNSRFDVGDDAICIKSGKDKEGRDRGMSTRFVEVDACVVHRGHGGFVVGSEMSGGVSDIRVSNCSFLGTDVGLRFKSRRGRGGVVENIHIENIRMVDIHKDAIIFNLFYAGLSPADRAEVSAGDLLSIAPEVTEETPQFRNISISGIQCHGAERALNVIGLPEMPVSGLVLENSVFHTHRGIQCLFATDLRFTDLVLQTRGAPSMEFNDVWKADISGVRGNDPRLLNLAGQRSDDIRIGKSAGGALQGAIELGEEVPQGAVITE